jgi:hypothetical protein
MKPPEKDEVMLPHRHATSAPRRWLDFSVYAVPSVGGNGERPEIAIVVEGILGGRGEFAAEEVEDPACCWGGADCVSGAGAWTRWGGEATPFVLSIGGLEN